MHRVNKEENKKRKLEGNKLGADITNKKTLPVQKNGNRKSHTAPTHTREQRAKLSGVSATTICKYDTVMKSDNKELQESMLSGNVKIGTAYKQVINERKKENENTNTLNNSLSSDSKTPQITQQYDEQTKQICEFMKTERKGDYNYDIESDIKSLHYLFTKSVNDIRDSIFDNHEIMEFISKTDCNTLINYLIEAKKGINNIIEKLEELKNEK